MPRTPINIQSFQDYSFTTTKWLKVNNPGWNPGNPDTIYCNPEKG